MRLLIAGLIAVGGCRAVDRIDADIPASVDRIALLEFDGDDLVASTPLVPYDPALGLPVERGEGRTVLVGWDADTLDASRLDGPVTIAATCDQTLGAPLWSVEWLPSGQLASFDAPPLAAGQPACPELETVRIEAVCLDRRCPATVVDTRGCSGELDLTTCGLGRPIVRSATPTACIEVSDDPDCAFTVHGPRTPAPLNVTSVVPHRVPPIPFDGGILDTPTKLAFGWIADLVIDGDDVVVLATVYNDRNCSAEPRREIVRLDRVTTEVRTRVDARGCVDSAAIDPNTGDLLTAALRDGQWWLQRRRDDVRFEVAFNVPEAPDIVGHAMVVLPARNRVAALLAGPRDSIDRGFLVLAALDTLAITEVIELDARAFAMAAASDGEVVLAHGRDFFVSWRDVTSGEETRREPVRSAPPVGRSLLGIHADQRGVFTVGFDALFQVGPREVTIAVDYASGGWPFVVAPAPNDQLFVFSTEPNATMNQRDLLALRYDPVLRRFEPEVTTIGSGIATRARTDIDGAVWLALPWSGEVLRVR